MAPSRKKAIAPPAGATLTLIATPDGVEFHLAHVPPAAVAAAAAWLEAAYAMHLESHPLRRAPDVVPGGQATEVRDDEWAVGRKRGSGRVGFITNSS